MNKNESYLVQGESDLSGHELLLKALRELGLVIFSLSTWSWSEVTKGDIM
jgi:hypothetical protein